MPRATIELDGDPVADRMADASVRFPSAVFKILAALPTDDGLLDVVQIETEDGEKLIRHFTEESTIRSVDIVYSDEQMVLLEIEVPPSDTYDAIQNSGIIPQQPVELVDGWYTNEMTASSDQLSSFMEELAAAGIPYRVESVKQSHGSGDTLTERQREFVETAIEHGFYEIPRECTLEELAAALDVNVSAISRLRHRAESHILTQFVTETTL